MDYQKYPALAEAARGQRPAEVVLKNAQVVNVLTREIVKADVAMVGDTIVGVGKYAGLKEIDLEGKFVAPGFIDAHLHLESTMVTPPHLLENSLMHGTTTYIADPHEAANVCGWDGIRFLLEQTQDVPANVYFMLPSCVPAAPFEMAGCIFGVDEMRKYKDVPRVLGLGEVMDYVSVVSGKPDMLEKLKLFEGMPRDGHAPGLSPADLSAYILAGISTDHECMTFEEARDKRRLGMHIHIREGSAAHNLEALMRGILDSGIDTDGFSFCTDDLHIEDIRRVGHIDRCIRKAISLGLEPLKAYQMASINTARCYGLRRMGAVAPGYQADFVILNRLETVEIDAVWHRGTDVSHWKAPAQPIPQTGAIRNTVRIAPISANDFALPVADGEQDVIGLLPGQIATAHLRRMVPAKDGMFHPADGLLKLAVIERHHKTGAVGVAILSGFGLSGGAIASSVSHDSHNLLVAGDCDADMLLAVEELQRVGGGYTIVSQGAVQETLPLPLMGLISEQPFEEVDARLHRMRVLARRMGVPEGIDPFITLSFLALPVIPALRLTPRGLFDVERFALINR